MNSSEYLTRQKMNFFPNLNSGQRPKRRLYFTDKKQIIREFFALEYIIHL